MQKAKRVWEWLVKSSVDAQKWSLFAKSLLLGAIPVTVSLLGLANVNVGSEELTEAVNIIAEVIVVAGGVITGVSAFIGLVRKLFLTLTDENDVVLGWSDKN